jgi:hypothetical protein
VLRFLPDFIFIAIRPGQGNAFARLSGLAYRLTKREKGVAISKAEDNEPPRPRRGHQIIKQGEIMPNCAPAIVARLKRKEAGQFRRRHHSQAKRRLPQVHAIDYASPARASLRMTRLSLGRTGLRPQIFLRRFDLRVRSSRPLSRKTSVRRRSSSMI